MHQEENLDMLSPELGLNTKSVRTDGKPYSDSICCPAIVMSYLLFIHSWVTNEYFSWCMVVQTSYTCMSASSHLRQVCLDLVSGISSLLDPSIEGNINSIPLLPQLIVAGIDDWFNLIPQVLGSCSLWLWSLDVVVGEFCPAFRHRNAENRTFDFI